MQPQPEIVASVAKRITIPTAYTEAEAREITKYANGDRGCRGAAIVAYRRVLAASGVQNDAYSRFMSEVDNPMPDYYRRHHLRAECIAYHIHQAKLG